VVSGAEFYQREEIRTVLAYLQLINNPQNNGAFLQVVNTPARGIGKQTLARLSDAAQREGMPLLDAARRAGLIPSLGKRAALALARFVALCDHLREAAWGPVEHLLERVLSESGYREQLRESASEEDQQRLANIEELLTVAREFDRWAGDEAHLEAFLDQTSLVNDIDDWEQEDDRVSLMTLHAAKGLEFPVVFVIAFEQGQLPHERSKRDAFGLEEERRLLFVGITRAQEELQLSLVQRRTFRGRETPAVPSDFAIELPRAEMHVVGMGNLTRDAVTPSDELIDDQPVWTEEEFVQDGPGPVPAPAEPPALPIMTAAELLRQREGGSAAQTPEAGPYQTGMAVIHPEHGVGKIVELAGRGRKRTATVDFAVAGRRKIVLAFASLQPAPR
jgi:DNA helicase-2/ATP-dependent DNA helicase PcrA